MDRRIYGLENEYGVTCTLRGQRRLSPDEVARYLFRRVVSWGRSSNVFLANGARLYLDVGSHPEYATPECDSLADLVAHDKAGERILEQLLESAEQRLAEEGIRGDIYLFRNNTDSAGNSYGCHENYLTSRHDDLTHYTEVLIPFLVSRQIYAGAGKVLQTARGAQFSMAQRAEHIWEGVSSATTRSRPIINTRDEPHADSDRYRRLHVIVGDSNMSEYATYLKVGATALLLRMLEDPTVVLRDMTLENPIRAIREISHDITCTRRVRLANGREASALEIQTEYLNRALRYADNHDLSPEEKQSLDMWEHVVTGLERDPLSLDREVDWVTKHNLIEAFRERHDLPLSHPRVALLDLQYHDISRNRSVFYKLQRAGRVERIVTDADIEEAVDTPPQTTRAPEEKQSLDMWEHVVTGLERDPLSLDREVDWVTKHNLIEAFRERHDLPLSHPRVALLDLQYHDISRNRSVFYKLQRAGRVERIVTDADIEEAVDTPPQTTRARLRGEFIRTAKERKRDYTVDWVHLKLNDQAQRTVLCKDPFKAHDERVERLIESL